MRCLPCALLALALAACGDATDAAIPPVRLAVVAGDQQSTRAGSAFPEPVVLQATDPAGRAVAGARLRWTLDRGAPRDTVLETDADGRVELVVRGDTVAGGASAEVSPVGSPGGATTVHLTILAGEAMRADPLPDSVRVAVDPFEPPVPVFRDRWGNIVTERAPKWTSADTSVVLADRAGLRVRSSGEAVVTARLDSARVSTRLVVVGWAAMAAGGATSCAVTTEGRLYCWGADAGLFGGAPAEACASGVPCHPHPVAVFPELRLRAVTVGVSHACGLDTAGAAWCWGQNDVGQLGDGTTTDRAAPVPAAEGHAFVDIAAGRGVTCGREAAGQAWCWGARSGGQIGDGQDLDTPAVRAVAVAGGPYDALVAGGGGVCGLTPDGAAECWGFLYDHSEGITAYSRRHRSPIPWGAPLRFDDLALGTLPWYCGVDEQRDVVCWGHNDQGQLGNGSDDPATIPTLAVGVPPAKAVAAGTGFACAITESGGAWCWGASGVGQTGSAVQTTCRADNYPCSPTPAPLAESEGKDLRAIAAGDDYSLALDGAGRLYGWGFNLYGETAASRPAHVSLIHSIALPL